MAGTQVQLSRVWPVLEAQGRMLKWLAGQTGIPHKRLFNLKYGEARGAYRWREDEVAAVCRALGVPREVLFPSGCPVLPRRGGQRMGGAA